MTVLVGLMSGTSLDGISAAVVRFREPPDDGRIVPDLLAFVSRPYDTAQRDRLRAALTRASPQEYSRLDFDLGSWLADAAVVAIAEAGVARSDIAAICSHGHTVWHDAPRSTWQIGNAAVIAERTGVAVISDLRSRDIAAGGQGAPLVTIADAMLFSATEKWRATLNLGGIANVQLIPPRGELSSVRAFDTGPGVGVIDAVVRTLVPALQYDADGALARRGAPVVAVVDELLRAPFFSAPPPKSTGRELFTAAYVAALIASCRAAKPGCSHEDIIATATSLTARSVALAFEKFIPEPVDELLISGGGARNPALFDAIRAELGRAAGRTGSRGPVVAPFESVFFDGDAKEAVAFAFLGWLHLERRPGNVPNATGARGPRILGSYTPA
ncbi:MAG: anhydro-N-acetylmuramic acid kinase [Gemmatimonadaceae bacterium]